MIGVGSKKGGVKQEGYDAFIRDTRQKTGYVFDRISEADTRMAVPARRRAARRNDHLSLEMPRIGVGLGSGRTLRPD